MNKFKKYILMIFFVTVILILSACEQPQNNDIDPELGVDPNTIKAFIVTYKTEMGETPEQIALVKGSKILKEHLPALSVETGYFDFNGWYLEESDVSPSDFKKILPGEYKLNSNITLIAKWIFNHYDYIKTDTSKYVINPTGNSTFSIDGDYLKATVSTTSISNWGLPRQENGVNYALSNVYGFEQKVKCDTQIGWAGALWYNIKGYNNYTFEIHGDGSFRVQFHNNDENKWEKIIDLNAENSHIIQNDFNTLSLVPTRSSDFVIQINGNTVGTIKREELKITPGSIYFAATAKKKGTKGTALLKFLSYSQLK